jgi:hypothetical protein
MAFAKLVGRIGINNEEDSQRVFLITEFPCALGRALLNKGGSLVIDPNDTLLSRQHVQINWIDSEWIITCLSKNGCTVDKKKYKENESCILSDCSAIRIGNARLYFTLPAREGNKRPYSEALPGSDDEDGELIMCLGGVHSSGEIGTKTINSKTVNSKIVNSSSSGQQVSKGTLKMV